MKQIKVSVIIPTFNRGELLKLSLDSLVNQNVSKSMFEVIVVDDGSTDNTRKIIEDYQDSLNIKYFYQENKGYRLAKARNIGISNSSGEICFFLDSGILVASDIIARNIEAHDKNDNQDYAVLGVLYGFDEHGENEDVLLNLHITGENVDESIKVLDEKNIFDLRESLYQELGDDLSDWPAPWAIFWAGFSSIKRDTLFKYGMFDEAFNTWGGEDVDLGITLFKNKVKIILDRKMMGIHYPHEKFKPSLSPEALVAHTKEKKKFLYQKHPFHEMKLFLECSSFELNRRLFRKSN